MSIDVVRKQIEKFLSSSIPEVMAIKGEWGVGKTYTWKKFLTEAKQEGKISLDRYSYVSLFGINSLNAFKYSIFENVVKKDLIGTEASIETFRNNTLGLIESLGRKGLNIFKRVSTLDSFSPAIESLSFLSLNQTLICIDDLERKGSELDVKDVLGLISQLKEQKNCKIVLLLNDGEEGLDDYDKYREKVIDFELKFDPSPEECVDIAYEKDGYEFKTLKELVKKLGIKNIRVLKKIERLVEKSYSVVENLEEEVRYQVIHSLALFSWCYYCSNSDDNVPTLDYVTDPGYSLYGIGNKEEEEEKTQKWKMLLREYDYKLMDELNLVLAEAVRTGYFVEEQLERAAKNKNKQVMVEKSQDSFSKAWSLYHYTFENNSEEVISGIYESFKKNVKHINPSNLNATVTLFRELDAEQKASEIIDIYLNERKDELELFNLKRNKLFGDIKDPEVVEKFNSLYKSSIKMESAKQVLDRIADKNGWNPEDEIVLANTSIDEYYQLFKSEKGRHLSSYVDTCLKFGRFGNATDRENEISRRATEALKKIASESKINKRRIKIYGIDV